MASQTLFRVHFEDGERVDVTAANPDAARAAAKKRHEGVITKVKRVRDTSNG
ncbi:hypothetical protein JYU29_05860 [Tianweitania sp. BSSL-BM11]|uniref:DUF2188 domain-containing protein n=1 Tax=Tianweitania aestuarii TaxID=2814886 RepID=A0ABS5RV61_9HYPH|nr:hypothetical protein [Tianweitania aestuarii]MBS9720212.1 hypothetical protein [Tianweitania aestuarii]